MTGSRPSTPSDLFRRPARGTLPLVAERKATLTGNRADPLYPRKRAVDNLNSEWQHKGATLSDKTARKEFGLTRDEIVQAIRGGKLQYRHAAMHGNPFLRLLRREVEALVERKHGNDYLKDLQTKNELTRIDCELKLLKTQIADLEERRACLLKASGRRVRAGS
jgi:hypothetical protein